MEVIYHSRCMTCGYRPPATARAWRFVWRKFVHDLVVHWKVDTSTFNIPRPLKHKK